MAMMNMTGFGFMVAMIMFQWKASYLKIGPGLSKAS
jgi:hypothetical protein